jgi:hypothetical protein
MLSSDLNRHAGKFYGKYSGQVTDNQDDNKLGCVKIKVPSVFGPDLEVSARPCLPYGHFFVPAVGARVWVEFEAGDPQFPLWVGIWYASGEVPPGADVSPPQVRVIKTEAGHRIELGDADGSEYIRVKHKNNSDDSTSNDGTLLEFDKDGNVKVAMKGGPILTLTKDKATLAFDDQTQVTLESGKATVTASAIELTSDSIKLGGDAAAFSPVKGEVLVAAWTSLLTHTHSCAVGPTSPPVGVLSVSSGDLSNVVKFK